MTVKEIAAKAQDYELDPHIALKIYLRTADAVLKEAKIYLDEQNDPQAYLLLMRYATLIAEKLPRHPSAKEPEARIALRAKQKTIPSVLSALETLQPRITARYEAWQKIMDQRRDASEAGEGERRSQSLSRSALAEFDPAIAGNTHTLDAENNTQLAVKIAQQEFSRRDANRRAIRQAGISDKEEQERRTAGLWDNWEASLSRDSATQIDEEMRRNMEASRRRMNDPRDSVSEGPRGKSTTRKSSPQRTTEFRYPSIPKSQPREFEKYDSRERMDQSETPQAPPRPPKDIYYDPVIEPTIPPSRPDKVISDASDAAMSKNYIFKPSAYLESGQPLRTIFIPPGIRTEFLRYVEPNTRRNLETCGMLCGTLSANALFIKEVVIPEQRSTSDTCDTSDEIGLFSYCDREDLMVLGWIHTHPSQTCFLSSRDVHTQASHQGMLAESIAIVCAPSKTPS